MKKKFLLAVASVAALVGCVHSLHPLYTEKDLVFDPALVGTWREKDGAESWNFEKGEGKFYKLTFTDDKGKTGEFQAALLKIDGQLFLDLAPDRTGLDALNRNDLYKFHLLPAHTFARVNKIEPDLELGFLNPDFVKKLLEADPKAIRHEKIEDTPVLTASTEELQKFLLKHLKSPGAFGDSPMTLFRKSTPPKP